MIARLLAKWRRWRRKSDAPPNLCSGDVIIPNADGSKSVYDASCSTLKGIFDKAPRLPWYKRLWGILRHPVRSWRYGSDVVQEYLEWRQVKVPIRDPDYDEVRTMVREMQMERSPAWDAFPAKRKSDDILDADIID